MSEKKNIVRRLYDWVLSWSETKYGSWALFVLAFTESSFFPIPPDPLLIALCLGKREKSFRFAAICSVASVLGGAFGYLLGWGLWESLDTFFYDYVPGFKPEGVEWFKGEYDRHGFWIVFAAGFTPIPYKIITVVSGALVMNFWIFLVASAISRSARFFLVSGLIYRYGSKISGFIDRYFDKISLAFVVLLVGGFAAIKWLF